MNCFEITVNLFSFYQKLHQIKVLLRLKGKKKISYRQNGMHSGIFFIVIKSQKDVITVTEEIMYH